MNLKSNSHNPEEIREENILEMGLAFSAMIRLFKKGEKPKLLERLLQEEGQAIFKAESQKEFSRAHTKFCNWGTKNILLAQKRRKGKIIQPEAPASYGQIAKTLDVTLKVAVYYAHLPNCNKSQDLLKWLNAAVDTKMVVQLKKQYPDDIRVWPKTIKQVSSITYVAIQNVVRKFIKEYHNNQILPVQFDEIYWNEWNQ